MKYPSDFLLESKTDKILPAGNYGGFYDLLIFALHFINKKPIRVLEVGVTSYGEGSGHAFSKMPFIEKFVGVDTDPIISSFSEEGVFIQADAYCEETIKNLSGHGPFHLIIDDGSHHVKDQIFFLKNYKKLLAIPGILVCEDVFEDQLQEVYDGAVSPGFSDIHYIRTAAIRIPEGKRKGSYLGNLLFYMQLSERSPIKT